MMLAMFWYRHKHNLFFVGIDKAISIPTKNKFCLCLHQNIASIRNKLHCKKF